MTNLFQRESVEFQPVTVTVAGVAVTTGVTFSVTAEDARPATFSAATTLSGQIGVMVDTLDPGTYRVWAQITGAPPETPVLDCGTFRVA